jgi:hypothetical protein
MNCSTRSIVDGVDLGFADSGDVLWKGMSDSRRLNASKLDSLDGDDPRDTGIFLG